MNASAPPNGQPFAQPTALRQLHQAQAWAKAGRWDEAMQSLRCLAPEQLGSESWAYWTCLGQSLGACGQLMEALSAFDRALVARPNCAQALVGRATIWAQLGEHGRSGRDASAAAQLEPNSVGAQQLLANALLKVGQPFLALAHFARLEALAPASPFVGCLRLFLARRLALWQAQGLPMSKAEFNELSEAVPSLEEGLPPQAALELVLLRRRALQGLPALEPLASMHLFDDPQLHAKAAQTWLGQFAPITQPYPVAECAVNVADADEPLRVAYLSSDFYNHATAWLLAGVLRRHDKQALKVFLISYGLPKDDAMTQCLTVMGHEWVDASRWTDQQVVQYCRANQVDIAVDLKGLTQDGRTGIFAMRAAPVQVNWLGYPGTMPASYYDYIIADEHVLPASIRPNFAEKVVYLPHSYQPTDDQRALSVLPGDRSQQRLAHGLPASALVVCSFNGTAKITPQVWAIWMRLLRAQPQSVLWLQAAQQAQENLRRHAQAAQVDPSRLVFAAQVSQEEHLGRIALADLSLDTWPYGAHTTASDALWAGVPHLTMAGKSFQARVGASLLSAMGVPELITQTPSAYEKLAARLLADSELLDFMRQKVQSQRSVAALFDTNRFTKNLEAAFFMMGERHRTGLEPMDMCVC